MVFGWVVNGSLGEKWGRIKNYSWKVGRGNIYESMEEYLPLRLDDTRISLFYFNYDDMFFTVPFFVDQID